jgi:hypothetical protein
MATKKVTVKKGTTKTGVGGRRKQPAKLADTAASTAQRIAALMEDPRLPTRLRAALADEVNSFATHAGGLTGPAVLLAAYPAMCAALGFDGLAPVVTAIRKPEPEEEHEPVEPEYEYSPEDREIEVPLPSRTMHDNSLAHWLIFKGDTVHFEKTARIKRNKYERQIGNGDLVVLKVKRPREGEPDVLIGEVRFEPGKVVLVSHQQGQARRAFDKRAVLLVGRVDKVVRAPRRPFYEGFDIGE